MGVVGSGGMPLASIDSIGGAVAPSSTAGVGSTTTAANGTSSGRRGLDDDAPTHYVSGDDKRSARARCAAAL